MHVLVTGAGGFVGAGLVDRLLHAPPAGPAITRLSLVDRGSAALPPADARVKPIAGDFGDAALLDAVLATPVDLAFHLASVPGVRAERDAALGWQVNLLGTLELARRLAAQARPARLVFASSVAVYGSWPAGGAHEDSPPRPQLSYGAHKLIAEVALADLSRRGELDAVSLRLPGVVARPPADSGHGSAFMSQLFHRLAAGERYACPVSPEATAWWMSLAVCVDNLLHAARLPSRSLPSTRGFQLPVLHATVAQVADALARRHGAACLGGLSWLPDARIESLFGRMPPLDAPAARAAGFTADADADALVRAVGI